MRYYCYICNGFPDQRAITYIAQAICLFMCFKKHAAKITILLQTAII